MTSTTTASKYIPKRPRICINWNPPFQTQIYLVKVPINVNIVKQDLLHKKQFLKILWSEVWKGGFQLIQILGLMGMYFDTVVVEVETFLLLFRLALAILCYRFFITFLFTIIWHYHLQNFRLTPPKMYKKLIFSIYGKNEICFKILLGPFEVIEVEWCLRLNLDQIYLKFFSQIWKFGC